MSERDLPVRALAANSAQCNEVSLSAAPQLVRIIARADRGSVKALGDMVGVELPIDPCRSNQHRDRAALWLGPDEWLVLADESVEVPAAYPGGCIVDVSHAMTGIAVSGSRADWAISTFCALDLHLVAFPVGMCTRTVLGKAEIVLWRTAVESFRIEVARSFAPYVWGCLEAARHEFLA